MARLSEPPNESIESLTRRFVRQNRDLTRVNATQSIKIRALENQVGALLAENLSLRENVIQLRTELDDGKSRDVQKNLVAIQKQLDGKLREIQILVAGLGSTGLNSRQRKSSIQTTEGLPKPRSIKATISTEGPNLLREGQLPTIVEDKYFPRKTLDSIDLQNLIAVDSSQSPEIQPPPELSFDQEEGFSAAHGQTDPRSDVVADDIDIPVILSSNFDTRRRRRETYVVSEDSSEGSGEIRNSDIGSSARPVRAGAKRKLEPQDPTPSDPQSQFQFMRRRHMRDEQKPTEADLNVPHVDMGANIAPVVLRPPVEEINSTSPRRALATKNPNMSPRKLTASQNIKDLQASKQPLRSSRPVAVPRQEKSIITMEADNTNDTVTAPIEIKLEPITPAPTLNIISPVSTQPSDLRSEASMSRPLSPRPNLANSNGRTSRRARSNVSYAEPNLISKMRRPTKSLADAVAPEPRHRASLGDPTILVKSEDDCEGIELPRSSSLTRIVLLHKMDAQNKDWRPTSAAAVQSPPRKPEPKSPLGSKGNSLDKRVDTALSRSQDRANSRDRRRSSIAPSSRTTERSASSSTISTVISSAAAQRDSPSKAQNTDKTADQSLQYAMQALDIYDVQDSPQRMDAASALTSATYPAHKDDTANTNTEPNELPRTKVPIKPAIPPASTTAATRPDLHRASSTSSLPPRSRPSSSTSSTSGTATVTSQRPSSRRQTLSGGSTSSTSSQSTTNATSSRSITTSVSQKASDQFSRTQPPHRDTKPTSDASNLDTATRGTSTSTRQGEADIAGTATALDQPERAAQISAPISGRMVERTANRRRSMML